MPSYLPAENSLTTYASARRFGLKAIESAPEAVLIVWMTLPVSTDTFEVVSYLIDNLENDKQCRLAHLRLPKLSCRHQRRI